MQRKPQDETGTQTKKNGNIDSTVRIENSMLKHRVKLIDSK